MNLRSKIATLAAALLLTLALPATALATYTNTSTAILAHVRTDGSLNIAEQRTYDFADDYTFVTWRITGFSDAQKVEPGSVRITQIDPGGTGAESWTVLPEVTFQSAWRDFAQTTGGETGAIRAATSAPGAPAAETANDVVLPDGQAYAFDARQNTFYIFLGPTRATTAIECNYIVRNAALVYDDVGELYWDYVPQSRFAVENVLVQVQLPVPEGAPVTPGKNLLAWGHGAPGTVAVNEDGTVDYGVPLVRAGQYAQAHIVFPKSWMTNLSIQEKIAKSGTRYDDAVAEEASWVDSYSGWRINSLTVQMLLFAACLAAIVVAAVVYLLLGREPQPRECREGEGSVSGGASGADADERVAELPLAIAGRLMRWNHVSTDDFAATLVDLAQKGVISIEELPDAAARFRVTPSAKKAPLTPLEQDAMKFMFDMVGGGYQSVSLADVEEYCRRHQPEVKRFMQSWQTALTKDVEKAALFDPRSSRAAKWLLAVAAAFAAGALFQWLAMHALLEGAALAATAAIVGVIAHHVPRLTQKGADISECLRLRGEAAEGASDGGVAPGLAGTPDPTRPWMARLSEMLENTILK